MAVRPPHHSHSCGGPADWSKEQAAARLAAVTDAPCAATPQTAACPWSPRSALSVETDDGDACSTQAPTELDLEPLFAGWASSVGTDLEDDALSSPSDAAVFDVIADEAGDMLLLPVGGGGSADAVRLRDLPEDAVVTIRTVRFFEDIDDAARPWERELRNVNSGSLLWAVVHTEPRMHSAAGAKYGRWFTIHHIRVRVACFAAGYHMAEEGACPAKTFGSTVATKRLVTGQSLPTGYFWFVTPAARDRGATTADDENLRKFGWQHVYRQGPFDGEAFLAAWKSQGSPLQEGRVQALLQSLAA